MNNIKYKNILELENKYKNTFSFCKTNKISLLPPILKKIGRNYFFAFLVIEDNLPYNNEVKRPIGIICINLKNQKEYFYDLKSYEFCSKNNDFNLIYYQTNNTFWPKRTIENEEKYRICLDYLQKAINKKNIFKKTNLFYEEYLNKVKLLFPTNYWIFFENLQNNHILKITHTIYEKRKRSNEEFLLEKEKKELLANKLIANKKNNFKEKFLSDIFQFCKKEILPILKGKGTYSKIQFFDLIGKEIKNIKKNIEKYSNCYNPLFNENTLKENYAKTFELTQIEIIKLFSKACNNNFLHNAAVDTIGKVLLVFLNALFIEELNGQAIQSFEEEISECINIFYEDNNRITNKEAKSYLTSIFNDLKHDYYTTKENNLSDIYTGYININKFGL